MKKAIIGAAIVCGSIAAVAAVAQPNWQGNPLYGTHSLNGGFMPDPYRVSVTAGGTTNARTMGLPAGCVGNIAAAQPDVRFHYSAGSLPLTIKAESGSDTTLIINAPDGQWYCNDDWSGLNPAVRFSPAMSGQYDIWVGTYGSGTAAAQVLITEL